jgi:hypothetical protein
MKKVRFLPLLILVAALAVGVNAQQRKMYWGNEVPPGWNGKWPAGFLTVPEKTNYARTTNTIELHEFITTLKWNSENVHVIPLFTSALRKVSTAVVLANPRVTSPEEAKKSGKPVIYLQGSIHPPESEGTEAMLMVMRDILLGKKKHLLDNQIIVVTPIFNVDGTETLTPRQGTPHIGGTRQNAAGFDLNRDGVKLETVEVQSLYRTIFNRWDPVMFYDAHRMGGGNFAYANAYSHSTVPAAHPAPRGYVWEKVFPAVRDIVRRDFGLETFLHANFDEKWPPTYYSYDRTIWSVEAKFLVNNYGLRNRMSILTETPGLGTFERSIYGQYAYILGLLEYTNEHGKEMERICREADEDTVAKVLAQSESGQLRNWVQGKYESWGKMDVMYYKDVPVGYLPGTSVRTTLPNAVTGPPQVVSGIENLTRTVGTKDAWVPRAYLLPADLEWLVERLRIHNVKVDTLEKPMKATGEQFVVDRLVKEHRGGYNMTWLEGGFYGPSTREFPAGTFFIDMAQPMANGIFYYLEPQSTDGFVGWSVLDDYLRGLGVDKHPVVYPVFKFRTEVKDTRLTTSGS